MIDTFESLKNKLAPLGLYTFSSSNVQIELWVYGAELDRIAARLERMYEEAFVRTATTYGLDNPEQLYGRIRDTLTVEERRELILKRMSLTSADFTPAGIARALESFHLTYVLSEYPAQQKVNIITEGIYEKADQAWISAEVQKIMPAHLLVQLVFNSMRWSDLDEENLTFSQLDERNNSWDDFDSRERNQT